MSVKKAIPLKNYLTGGTVYDTLYSQQSKVTYVGLNKNYQSITVFFIDVDENRP
jgi:hypothetical protein